MEGITNIQEVSIRSVMLREDITLERLSVAAIGKHVLRFDDLMHEEAEEIIKYANSLL